MANFTKQAIQHSFRKLLGERPLNRITVKDIVEDCGINRNSFYYHYQDIPALLDEMIKEDFEATVAELSKAASVEDCLQIILRRALENRPQVLNIFRSPEKAVYKRYLMQSCRRLADGYLDKAIAGRPVSPEDRELIAGMLRNLVCGYVTEWLVDGMRPDILPSAHRLYQLQDGVIELMIQRACQTPPDERQP